MLYSNKGLIIIIILLIFIFLVRVFLPFFRQIFIIFIIFYLININTYFIKLVLKKIIEI